MDELYLGVEREVITPEIGGQLYGYAPDVFSASVEDDLTATAFYFRQGQTKAMLITVTVCSINTTLSVELRKKISEKTDVPMEHIVLCATHTHSGPNTSGAVGWGDIDRAYCDEIFVPRILYAAEKAAKSTQAVTMHVARGKSDIGVNRRKLLKDRNFADFGQTPWGPYDPHMTILSFKNHRGRTVANMIHYGCHGTSAGRNHEITRDWSGRMIDALEAATGGMTAFFDGPEGDVGPRLTNGQTTGGNNIGYVYEHGCYAAAEALRIYTTSMKSQACILGATTVQAKIPLKPRMEKEKAAQMLQPYANATINFKAQIRNHLEQVLRAYEEGIPEETEYKVTQTIVRLGDFIFVTSPFELFSEIGMRINDQFSDKTILSLSIANGTEGYFVTEDAICRGGYEVDMFLYKRTQAFAENADLALILSTVENIKGFLEEN